MNSSSSSPSSSSSQTQTTECSNTCFYRELLLFDSSKPAPKFQNIVIWTLVIMIYTFVIFRFTLREEQHEQYHEARTREYDAMTKKKINPSELAMAEFVNACVYAPIAEELFFRLFIFKTLLIKRLKCNVHIANVIQAVLFGLFHISNMLQSTTEISNVYLQITAATIGGLISGYAYVHSNSILPSFLAHAINNCLAIHAEISEYEEVVKNTKF